MKQSLIFFITSAFFLCSNIAFTQVKNPLIENDEWPLDPPYKKLKLIKNDLKNDLKNLSGRSDISTLLSLQTPVRSQGSRGTCSIFSSVGVLESLLVKSGFSKNDLDLSEEWVQYLAMRGRTEDGYWSFKSWNNIAKHGVPLESHWPYDGSIWKLTSPENLVGQRCGMLDGALLSSCLLGHRRETLLFADDRDLLDSQSELYDEEFYEMRSFAQRVKKEVLDGRMQANSSSSWSYRVNSLSELRKLIDSNTPLTLGLSFFYGAWNHGKSTKLGINRDIDNWYKGIVGYPEVGSIDRRESLKAENAAGHSVVLIGYDDQKVITTKQKMEDGTIKEFSYKGVYYFKNSWGTQSFGKDVVINGEPAPGIGMISQKYAHDYGSFYKLPFNK